MGIPYALLGPFAFPHDAEFDATKNEKRDLGRSFFGIDISHYTPADLNFDSLRQKHVSFVYMKVSQGRFSDDKFSLFWGHAHGKGLYVGGYHFLTAKTSETAEKQAALYLTLLGPLGPSDLPPVLDLEWDAVKTNPDRWEGHDPDEIISKAVTWLKIVEDSTGRVPIIYTNRAWWRERIGEESKFAALSRYPLWIADYSKSDRAVEIPTTINGSKRVLWQFAADAKINAFTGAVDSNIYGGDEEGFLRTMNISKLDY